MTEEISNFEEFDKPQTHQLTDKEVFTEIWTQPRKVFKFILEYNYEKYFYPLLFAAGACNAVENLLEKEYQYPLWIMLTAAILLGGTLGWIFMWIYAALVSWTGGWMGGKADTDQIYSVNVYSTIPSTLGTFFLVIQFALGKAGFYQQDSGEISDIAIILILALPAVILQIWSLVLTVVGVSVAQHFSWPKALLNLLLPALLIGLPIILIFLAFRN